MKAILFAAAAALVSPTAAMAQDNTAAELPSICTENAGAEQGGMGHGGMEMAPAGDAAHRALMAGMDRMNADMMAAGTASDIDVAFVCAMIPHHLGAISMARAELEHGDDQWVRALAEQIIAAQEKEIADMLAWLEQQQ